MQRSVGNAAVSRMIEESRHQHGAGCGHAGEGREPAVQRMPKELRDTTARRQQAAANAPRSARLAAQAGGAGTRVLTPRRDVEGRELWQGGRNQLNFPDHVQEAFYGSLASQVDANNVATYCCESCSGWVPRKRDAARGSKDFATIDHMRGIISRVNEEPVEEVRDAEGHTFDAMLLADAQAAAWDLGNLRMLCSRCNSSDGSVSESRTSDSAGPKHRRDCPACAAERAGNVQRLAASAQPSHAFADDTVQRSAVQGVLGTAGQPLAAGVRADMEARLGADFSDVRVHTDAAARASAAEVGAHAYTSGNHVVIGDGGGDRHTLAHELTHVIQQRSGPVAGTDNGSGLRISDPSDRFEREAEANAHRALSGSAPVARSEGEAAVHAPVAGAEPVQRMEAAPAEVLPRPLPDQLRDAFREADEHTQFEGAYWAFMAAYMVDHPEITQARAGSPRSIQGAQTIWNQVRAERVAAANAAQEAIAQRQLATRANHRGTWVMNPDTVYLNGAHPAELKDATREQLAMNHLRANGVGSNRFEPKLNERCHVHGLTDSQGVAFIYLLEPDFRVRAYVYDLAAGRHNGNEYAWTAGGRGGYTSQAAIPALAGSQERASRLPQT
nr:DUF4157 domain-containing protein [Streptacidiphilus sp. P02-A3a]